MPPICQYCNKNTSFRGNPEIHPECGIFMKWICQKCHDRKRYKKILKIVCIVSLFASLALIGRAVGL